MCLLTHIARNGKISENISLEFQRNEQHFSKANRLTESNTYNFRRTLSPFIYLHFSSNFLQQWLKKTQLVKVRTFWKGHKTLNTISHVIWHLLSKCQITRDIVSNFVACLVNLNFKNVTKRILSNVKNDFKFLTHLPNIV